MIVCMSCGKQTKSKYTVKCKICDGIFVNCDKYTRHSCELLTSIGFKIKSAEAYASQCVPEKHISSEAEFQYFVISVSFEFEKEYDEVCLPRLEEQFGWNFHIEDYSFFERKLLKYFAILTYDYEGWRYRQKTIKSILRDFEEYLKELKECNLGAVLKLGGYL